MGWRRHGPLRFGGNDEGPVPAGWGESLHEGAGKSEDFG